MMKIVHEDNGVWKKEKEKKQECDERSGIFNEIHRQSWHSKYYQRVTPTSDQPS